MTFTVTVETIQDTYVLKGLSREDVQKAVNALGEPGLFLALTSPTGEGLVCQGVGVMSVHFEPEVEAEGIEA